MVKCHAESPLRRPERRKVFQQRRQQMLSDKIDCAKFLTYFIEHYPESATQTRNATPEFWTNLGKGKQCERM